MKKFLLVGLLTVCKLVVFSQASSIGQQPVGTTKISYADTALAKVEIESEFPGGAHAWLRFLQDNLVYPPKAIKKNIQGTVVLQFIVDKDGTVSDIQAIGGPKELQQSAIDAMKKTPKWKPAIQFGKHVKSYKKQPIVYRLQ